MLNAASFATDHGVSRVATTRPSAVQTKKAGTEFKDGAAAAWRSGFVAGSQAGCSAMAMVLCGDLGGGRREWQKSCGAWAVWGPSLRWQGSLGLSRPAPENQQTRHGVVPVARVELPGLILLLVGPATAVRQALAAPAHRPPTTPQRRPQPEGRTKVPRQVKTRGACTTCLASDLGIRACHLSLLLFR
jgi:hypothetical protein